VTTQGNLFSLHALLEMINRQRLEPKRLTQAEREARAVFAA
jgi:hypothetical protein